MVRAFRYIKFVYRAYAISCAVGFTLFFLTISVMSLTRNPPNPPYTETERVILQAMSVASYDQYLELPELTRGQWKSRVNRAAGTNFYVEWFRDLPTPARAIPQLRVVIMNNSLLHTDDWGYYAGTLLHELVHLQHYSPHERRVTFHTFKLAWESGDKHLRAIALPSTTGHERSSHYNADGLIIEYLKKRGEFNFESI